MKILVLCPHFDPDTAPTGTVITRVVEELATYDHEIHVVTSLPWYRNHAIEPGWTGRWVRTERTAWGSITRVNPFPGDDKRNIARRAAGFLGFSALAGFAALRAGGWFRRLDAVLAMSPPLTLGLTGRLVGLVRRAPLVFNIQDVFPDAAVRTGALTNAGVIAFASWLERLSYRQSAAITVLSDDLRDNVAAKIGPTDAAKIHVIPNFVDTERIRPLDRHTEYRAELGLGDEPVVLYAGNVGFSQSLDLIIDAAMARPAISFVINGDGAAHADIENAARSIPNLHIRGYQPVERLSEVLATGDIHVVPLRSGLGNVSVPSKTYSSLAAARPVIAAIDGDSEVPRLLAAADAGVTTPPDNLAGLLAALDALISDPAECQRMGRNGRAWAVAEASPAAVGRSYDRLLRMPMRARRR